MNSKGKILLWSSNLWNFGDGMLGPLFAVFAEKIGGNILDIAWAWAAYLVSTGVFVIVVGNISDKFSKEKIVVLGFGLNAVLTFCYLLISSPAQLLMLQIGLGLAVALANPTWYALYAQYSPHKAAGYHWGLADGEARILAGLAVILGGLIVEFISFQALFILMGTIQIIATFHQAQILKK
ncbi:MAG: MFS transporter [Candidatus Komeilibacteria bacterium RIFCSPLOWO2_01_FULL_45_10]|uniref:MFS transporter n=1 Tax=Candidatus Komeilibacteria bacterium RIFCSPLOWO2_01_FULL_45_10 TaxID=1798550 RepID=A0A1G2BK74_9BACT|nr:MAG: MFS transporter [Candidatus Komeilibacteria bacterium RIFCSPLOWO2_01_FULL_45_10]